MPKVSVIITCYNLGRYLEEAVNSVLNQTLLDFEIIIVNDGSTDNATNRTLAEYQKPKTIVYHTENQGLPAARNYGIQRSKGEFIVCLDADDKLHPEFLNRSAGVLNETDHQVGFVPTGIRRFGNSDSVFIPPEYSPFHLFVENLFVCACMFRKKCWEVVGGYNENMRKGYEDWDFWLKLIETGYRWITIPEVLFYYRDRKDSMLYNTKERHSEQFGNLQKLHLQFISDHLIDILSAYNDIISISKRNSRSFEKQYQKMEASLDQLGRHNQILFEKYLSIWWLFHVEPNASTVAVLGSTKHSKWLLQFLTKNGLSMPAVVIHEKETKADFGVPSIPSDNLNWNKIKTIVFCGESAELITEKFAEFIIPDYVRILYPFVNSPTIAWPINRDCDSLPATGLVSIYNSFAYSSLKTMEHYLLGLSDSISERFPVQGKTILQARAILEPMVNRWKRQGNSKRVMIFGAGSHSKVLLGVVPSLFNFVVGFIDSDIESDIIGIPCYFPEKIKQDQVDVIIYSSAEHELEMYKSVAHLKVQHVLLYHQEHCSGR